MNIGENIKLLREQRNLKQSELAEELGVSDKTVSSWEINRTEPKMGMIEKICSVLGCKKADIIGGDDEDYSMPYYINDDARELAEFMFKNPEYKVLFDASRKVKKEDIDFVKQMIDRVRGDVDDTGC